MTISTARQRADLTQQPIDLTADGLPQATADGEVDISGNVVVKQGDRTLRTDAVHLDKKANTMTATGPVEYEDPDLLLSGVDANVDAQGGAELLQTNFFLKANAGRGSAKRIQVSPEGNLALDNVSYTTCPPSVSGWELDLSNLDINQATRTGTGRNVRLTFQGIPIFYTPWISFPVGDQRKSGLLYPNLGGSSRGGRALSVPYYFNLATNYDDTLTSTYDTARGFKFDNEFRYLSDTSKGQLTVSYLPHDGLTEEWRGAAAVTYRNDFTSSLRLDTNASEVRDTEWFEDFGPSRDITSQVYLFRTLELANFGEQWRSAVRIEQLQTLDTSIDVADRPYARLPSLTLSGEQSLPFGWNFALDSELAYFTRSDLAQDDPSITGARADLEPTFSMPLRARGFYLTPSVGWRYTAYSLQNVAADADSHPTLSAPIYSLDTGLTLEHFGGQQQQRLYTLEPRLLYTYVPYRDQSAIPLFDTGLPDLNLVQLFNTNRFNGPDRLGDTNQLSIGVTTRLLDAQNGQQFLSGTLGQAYYFKTPCVTALTIASCATETNQRSSDVIGQLNMTAYKNVSVNLGFQWDPDTQRSQRSDIALQYRRDGNHTVNLGYRFERGSVEQWETSFAWPIGNSFSGYGRVVYSQLDKKFLDHFAGLEYRSCCWNLRAVIGRAVTTRTGAYDTQYRIQLELKGLSSVGTADAFLKSAITGYSANSDD